jgi:hypothetical protein
MFRGRCLSGKHSLIREEEGKTGFYCDYRGCKNKSYKFPKTEPRYACLTEDQSCKCDKFICEDCYKWIDGEKSGHYVDLNAHPEEPEE